MQKFNLKKAITIFAVVILLISLLELRPPMRATKVKMINCRNNLKQIGLALYMYAQDNGGFFPDREGRSGFEMLRSGGYLENSKMYFCPSTTDWVRDGTDLTTAPVSYMYVAGLKQSSSYDTPVARDNEFRHNDMGYKIGSVGIRFTKITLIPGLISYPYQYGNVLFVDGHVEECSKERWEEIIKKNNFTY